MDRVMALVAASGFALTALGSYAQTPGQRLELDRKGETIVLEPYAPNILRVTLSLQHDPAVAKPGYGLVAAPEANDWQASQTETADVYRSSKIIATVDRPHGGWKPLQS
jgi:alpha-D-xyloside xylohydrolase